MKTKKKLQLLISYEEKAELKEKHLRQLIKFSKDKDSLVRSSAASLLINFENKAAKKALLELACDKKAMVRCEAYDSLSVFHRKDVEKFLKKAVEEEKNELALSYAIMSWADVAAARGKKVEEKRGYATHLQRIMQSQRGYSQSASLLANNRVAALQFDSVKKWNQCSLSCFYAEYVLGRKSAIEGIIYYLEVPDYQLRCGAINLLELLAEDENRELIRESLEKVLEHEETATVKSAAEKLLKKLS